MTDKRVASRYLCADIVRISWQGGHRMEAVLEDISAHGICVQLEESIAEGTRVQSYLGEQEFAGHVRYCKFQDIGWFIGIHFDDAERWSEQLYHPQHLTNLTELVERAG
jgi:PilZ domain